MNPVTSLWKKLTGKISKEETSSAPPSSEPEPEPSDGPSEAQITMVMESWELCVPIADTAADLFYGRLFESDPSLKEIFPSDMQEQKKKLMQTITFAVRGLKDLEAIVPAVEALGKRHVAYKVKEEHYPTVGSALLWTLEQGLGDKWNDELKKAWASVYGLLAETMIAAAREEEAAAPVSPEQVAIVQSTWEKCVPIADQAADLFYTKLFELDASLRALFPEDMTEQKKKLMSMITTAVRSLHDLETLVPVVQALGKRHNDYKVEAAHYETVGAALLWTLEQGLQEAWTDEAKEAWTAVYGLLAKVMIEAAEAA